jgi:hypothetical protein
MARNAAPLSIVLALVTMASACGGAGGGGGGGNGSGTGGGGGGGGSAADCEAVRAHVTALYQAEAAGKDTEAKRVAQAVADNTGMVMAECAREPGRVAGCAARARSTQELEQKCLAPLDDDGTEGDQFRPR